MVPSPPRDEPSIASLRLLLIAAIVGIAVGNLAVGFYMLIQQVQIWSFGADEQDLIASLRSLAWWQLVLAPTCGGLVVGYLMVSLLPEDRIEGVPEVIEAHAVNGGDMDARTGLATALVTVTALGTGASTGREGPMVHLGATVASRVGCLLGLTKEQRCLLLGSGAAAAVAASFNAPLAGIFFALEVVIGSYSLAALAPVVLAAVLATTMGQIHLGDFPVFTVPEYQLASFWELPAFILLGVVAAASAALFLRAAGIATRWRAKLTKIPRWAMPPIGGLGVGLIALAVPELLSVGYEAIYQALEGGYSLSILLLLLVGKNIATLWCLTCRFGAGVVSPALFIGAMTGGAYGVVAGGLIPDLASGPGLYAIVGMSAVASAILGAPISTILMAFELTANYSVMIAVLVASVISAYVINALGIKSFFRDQLERRGIRLPSSRLA